MAIPQVIAQLYAYLMTAHYREAYGIYACNGVCFNPESPCNGERLVMCHIAQSEFNMAHGHDECLCERSLYVVDVNYPDRSATTILAGR